jgi:FtsH-binding integral membrane protein
VFGLVALFVAIPGANVIFAVAGLVIFGGFTAYDFLDVLTVFQFFLLLFGGNDE